MAVIAHVGGVRMLGRGGVLPGAGVAGGSTGGLAVFLLLLATLVAGPLLFGATRPWSQSAMQVLGGFLGLAVLWRLVLDWRGRGRIGGPDVAVWLFVAYAGAHYALAPSEVVARREVLLIVLYAIVFYAAWRHLPGAKHARAVALIVGAIAFCEASYAIVQWLKGSPYIAFGVPRAPGYGMRAGGTFNCPNHFAGYLEMGLAVVLAFALFSKFPRWAKAALFFAAGVIVVGILLSVSRGGWISTGVALLVLALLAARGTAMGWFRPALLLVGFVAAVGVWLAVSPMARGRLSQMGGATIDVRTSLYRDALKMIPEAPWFGTGPATFGYVHPRFQGPECGETRARFTHCDYLNLACDYGLVGVVLVGGFLAFLGVALARARARIERRNDIALWAGSVTAAAAILAHSAVDFNMHIPSNAATFFALVALPLRFAEERESRGAFGAAARWSIVAAFGCVLGWYWVTTVRTAVGNAYWLRAHQLEGEIGVEGALALADRALAWDPGHDTAPELAGDYLRVAAAKAGDPAERARLGGRAISYYSLARRNNPWEVTTLVKQALTCDVLRRYPEAFMLYQAAIKADPRNWRILGCLAQHYWQRGMLDRAKETYGRAIELGGDGEIRRGLEALVAFMEAKRK